MNMANEGIICSTCGSTPCNPQCTKQNENRFNPDWDLLKATQESLREHMALLKAAYKEIEELKHDNARMVKDISTCINIKLKIDDEVL